MSFDHKIRLAAYRGKLLQRRAYVNIHHPVALHTSNVMMMSIPANPVVMASIGKINAVQQSLVDQHLDSPKYRGPSKTRVGATEFMPEFFHRKIGIVGSYFRKPFGNLIFRDRLPLTLRPERRPDLIAH